MKKFVIISSTVLSLILGIAAHAYAQQEQEREKQDQPNQQQKTRGQAKPEQQHGQQQQKQNQDRQQPQAQQQQQAPQQQKQDQNRQQEQGVQQQQSQDRQQQAPRQQQTPQYSQEQRRVQQSTWQDHRAKSWESDHRSWQQRGGYDGYRIPDDRYRVYFGSQHYFRIYSLPFMVFGGYPRFQYEGYWITLLDPWPEYWSNDWYDNDDVYIDYGNDGYYMYNRRYPSVAIAISISM